MAGSKKQGSIPGTGKKTKTKTPIKEVKDTKNKFSLDNISKESMDDALGNAGWDDLKRAYLECRGITVMPLSVTTLMTNEEMVSKIKDIDELKKQALVLSKDIKYYNDKLDEIHNRHKDRVGNCTDENDLVHCLNIGEEYQEWLISYQTVVMPTVNSILTMFNEGKNVDEEYTTKDPRNLLKNVN